MRVILRTTRFLNEAVALGTEIVQFDEHGVALGVVQRPPEEPLPVPEPLSEGAIEQARAFPEWFEIIEGPQGSTDQPPTPEAPPQRNPRRATSARQKRKEA